jgi:hypothetical protein
MRDARAAAQSDPQLNRWFRRRRADPPPLNRKRRLSGALLFATNTGNGNSIRNSGTGPALQLPERGRA